MVKRPIFRSRLAAWTVVAQTVVVFAMLVALIRFVLDGGSRVAFEFFAVCMVAEALVTLPLAVLGLKRFHKDS